MSVKLVRLGHLASYITAAGGDEPGREARLRLCALGVESSFIVTLDGSTSGVAHIELDAEGVPAFRIVRSVAACRLHADPSVASIEWLFQCRRRQSLARGGGGGPVR